MSNCDVCGKHIASGGTTLDADVVVTSERYVDVAMKTLSMMGLGPKSNGREVIEGSLRANVNCSPWLLCKQCAELFSDGNPRRTSEIPSDSDVSDRMLVCAAYGGAGRPVVSPPLHNGHPMRLLTEITMTYLTNKPGKHAPRRSVRSFRRLLLAAFGLAAFETGLVLSGWALAPILW